MKSKRMSVSSSASIRDIEEPMRRRVVLFRGRIGLAAMLLGVAAFVSCARAPDGGTLLITQADELQPETVPPDAEAYTRTNPNRDASSIAIHWEFETAWDRNRYAHWVTAHLQSGFEIMKVTETRLVFARFFEGDTESVEIEVAPKAAKLHVRVRVSMHPD